MQQPTCTNLRIRSTQDAHKIFYAIYKGVFHMVTRRLDANERLALTSGCVYAWEERGPHSEVTGLGIERFTEGRRWSPSRVRDEFLFYYEKPTPHPDANQLGLPADPMPPQNWDPLVKQTYSVWVETPKGRRKWHLTAYFTQTTVDDLRTIENIPDVQDLVVPPGMFKSTRVNKTRSKSEELSKPKDIPATTTLPHSYAPFFSLYNRYPTELASAPSVSESVTMYEPYPNSNSNPYPIYGQSDQSLFLQPVHVQPSAQSPAYSNASLDIAPAAHYQNSLQLNQYPAPTSAFHPAPHESTMKDYPPPPSVLSDYRRDPVLPSFNASSTTTSQWTRSPASESYAVHPSLPLYDTSAPYPFRSEDLVASSPSPSGSSISEFSPRRRHGETLESSYELHPQQHQAVHLPPERRGSIGPDRDLASIPALTRRYPYRRDPSDDIALRQLPPYSRFHLHKPSERRKHQQTHSGGVLF